MIRAAQERAIRKRYKEVAPVLDEQGRRRFAAAEALALGRGGVSLMARITGLARPTIYRGIFDIRNKSSAGPGRTRKVGGGRKAKEVQNPTLLTDLKRLVQPVTRGDPMRVILWTARSLRNLEKELKKLGHNVSPMTVGKLLRSMDYSLQANSKTKEGRQHVDRDRLLLGMKGVYSELELSVLRQRSHEALRIKAARGDLHRTVAPP
jgi:hypothetical protein